MNVRQLSQRLKQLVESGSGDALVCYLIGGDRHPHTLADVDECDLMDKEDWDLEFLPASDVILLTHVEKSLS